ncbi:hypothetical protein D3C84_747790 [compost metagenome]
MSDSAPPGTNTASKAIDGNPSMDASTASVFPLAVVTGAEVGPSTLAWAPSAFRAFLSASMIAPSTPLATNTATFRVLMSPDSRFAWLKAGDCSNDGVGTSTVPAVGAGNPRFFATRPASSRSILARISLTCRARMNSRSTLPSSKL